METKAQKMYVCLCGFEVIPKTISTKNRGGRFIMSEPVSAYLIETEEGYVLFDTGLNREIIHDPELEDKYFTSRGWIPTPISEEQHDLLYQFKQIGVEPEQVKHVVLSHLHADHTGNLKHFRHATIHIQREEYDFGFAETTPPPWFDLDYKISDLKWNLLDGDYKLMEGVEIIDTKGHTPGHQSLVVTLPNNGAMVLVADAGDLRENFEQEIPCGENIGDDIAVSSIRRLKKEVAERQGTLFLGHDPNWIQQIKLAPEFYD